jgi:4-amino-4-deoxy-L-arabinose transferase-like glycosyltransferase
MKIIRQLAKITLCIVVLFWLLWRLDSVPPLAYWWDEAWTMSVARNWVELGHFGQLLNGVPQSTGLSASFPVVMPVAWSFQLLGVGVWQGRLVTAGFTIAALLILFILAKRLYSSRIAWGAVLVALFLTPQLQTNPIYMGRQVMAEMPMIFFLLAGYLCLFLSFRHIAWALPMVLFWGVGIITKSQPLPFWAVSLLVPMGIALLRRQWRAAIMFVVGLIASWVASQQFIQWFFASITGHTTPGTPLQGLVKISALTLDSVSRQSAILMILLGGFPTVVGIVYVAWEYWGKIRKWKPLDPVELTRLALLGFSGSWLVWYLCLSLGWARYLMPVMFVGSMFVAKLFDDITHGFDIIYIIQTSGYAIRHFRFNWRSLSVIWFLLSVVYNVDISFMQWYQAFTAPSDGIVQVAEYLNTQTPQNALIETYESGILFLLRRPYHYPPDEVSVEILYKRANPGLKLDYDPLPANPDYLVVCRFAREVHLYDPALDTGQFHLIETIGQYDIYQHQH